MTVLEIAAEGAIKQFAAVKGGGGRYSWYDIQKELAPIPSVFASGTTLGARAETAAGKTFDLGAFDMVVESAEPAAGNGVYASTAAKQFYAVTLTVTNALRAPEKFGFQYATPALTDLEGKELHWSGDLIDVDTGQAVAAGVGAGQTVPVTLSVRRRAGPNPQDLQSGLERRTDDRGRSQVKATPSDRSRRRIEVHPPNPLQ